MLRKLTVKNFAIVEEVSFEVKEGLVVFTGETGAGKSILIEALGFLLGARAHLDWIRTGAQRCEVEAAFDLKDFPAEMRKSLGLKMETVRLRRELDMSGKSRAFLEGQAVPLSVLSHWGDSVLDFHGQHEHQTLLKPSMQMEHLDQFAGVGALRQKINTAYEEWNRLKIQQQSIQLSEEEKSRRIEMYCFQIQEIDEASLSAGEEEEMEILLPRLKNAEKIKRLTSSAMGALYEEEISVQGGLLKAQRSTEELAKLDGSVAEPHQLIGQALTYVEEAVNRLRLYGEQVDVEPEKLDEVFARQEKLARLKKKYGSTVDSILSYRERIAEELSALENAEQRAEALQSRLEKTRRQLSRYCEEIHLERLRAAQKLSQKIIQELRELGMPSVRFSISVDMEEEHFSPTGADQVEFMLSPNVGEPLKSLRSIASGGEISRVMLGLKTVFAQEDKVPVLVFDEIDTGVGGVIARAVGEKLFTLSRSHQVLCVTHLPQIACFGSQHFRVAKMSSDSTTTVHVENLDRESRLEEIARMLGGNRQITQVARSHARELLEKTSRS
ncbi:MAG: DNA repair protein RecN [Elusimicrobia bacterium]|nr:DNA repair protein RecN [Elusimicrobiota bacterium]